MAAVVELLMEVGHMAAAMVVVAMATQVVPVAHHHGGNSVGRSSTVDGFSHLFSHGFFFLFSSFSIFALSKSAWATRNNGQWS